MSYNKTKLGYVQLHASEVVERSEAALARIKASREKSAEQFITNMMEPKKGWFFGHPARTREQALAAIKADQYMSEEYWYVTKYVSPKQESLAKLLRVGLELLNGGNTTMQISIETAAWLYPEA
jgi:hypothetical protein